MIEPSEDFYKMPLRLAARVAQRRQRRAEGTEEEPELDPKQMKALEMLAEGAQSLTKVAEAVGVDRKTLWRWRQIPEFRDELECLTGEMVEAAHWEIEACARAAAARLVQGLSDPGPNGLRAARDILDRIRDSRKKRPWRR